MTSAGPNPLLYTGTFMRNATAVAPGAGQVIADSGQLPAGLYLVSVAGSYGGVADVIDNMEIWVNGDRMSSLPVAPVVNGVPIFVSLAAVAVYEGGRIQVKAIAAGGAGSVFRGTIIATPVKTLNLV